jgi:hypothetical protein
MIIRGFLTAMASFGLDYATAREYLTEEAAAGWYPKVSDVLIYASGTTPRVSGTQVTMSAPVIGFLRPDGSFVGADEPIWTHDFGMVKEDNEWRISTPPEGLALSQYMFSQSFMRIDTYFFPENSSVLVPDPRYVHRGAWDRTSAANLVVSGPSRWLESIIDTSIREEVHLADDVVLGDLRTAEIPLSPGALKLSIEDATTLAIEIAATMRELPGVDRIRLTCEGSPLPLMGATADRSIPVSAAQAYDPSDSTGPRRTLSMVRNNLVATLVDNQVIPVEGDWGTTPRQIRSFAVSESMTEIAGVVDDSLLVGKIHGDPPAVRIQTAGLLRPHYDSRGNLWAFASHDGRNTLSMITPDTVVTIDASTLNGMEIRGFQVAPDGHRILMLREADQASEGSRMELGIAMIVYEQEVPAAIISWKPIRLTWESSPIRSIVDMGWMGPSSLVVLGSTGGSHPGVFFTDIDGLGVEEWGQPQAWDSTQMVVRATDAGPQIIVLDVQGSAWFYQDGYHWTRPETDALTSVALPP